MTMDAPQAFAAIALAAVACDGSLGRDEARALRRQLEHRTPYVDLGEDAMGELFDGLLSELRQHGIESLLAAAVPALDHDQRETALAVAAELIHADHHLQPGESAFLEGLAGLLELPDGRAERVLAVIAALHRDSLAG